MVSPSESEVGVVLLVSPSESEVGVASVPQM